MIVLKVFQNKGRTLYNSIIIYILHITYLMTIYIKSNIIYLSKSPNKRPSVKKQSYIYILALFHCIIYVPTGKSSFHAFRKFEMAIIYL